MEKKYKYRYDRRCRRITAALLLILAGLFVWFHFVLGGDYLPAWGLFFVVCIITLYILSIPRYILLDDAALEIHCIGKRLSCSEKVNLVNLMSFLWTL